MQVRYRPPRSSCDWSRAGHTEGAILSYLPKKCNYTCSHMRFVYRACGVEVHGHCTCSHMLDVANLFQSWFGISPSRNITCLGRKSCHPYLRAAFVYYQTSYKFPMLLTCHRLAGENSCYHPAIISTITCA